MIWKRKEGQMKRHRINLNSPNPGYRINAVIPEYLSVLPEGKRLMFYRAMTETYLKRNNVDFGDPQDQALFNLFKTILDYENVVVERRKP